MKAFTAMEPENDLGWVYDALHHPEYEVDGVPKLTLFFPMAWESGGEPEDDGVVVEVQELKSKDSRRRPAIT